MQPSPSPADLSRSPSRAIKELQRIHRRAVAEYRPQPYAGRMTLFRARERSVAASGDPTMGWGRVVAGGVEIFEVPGNHLTMLESPNLLALAETLGQCLAKAQEQGDASSV